MAGVAAELGARQHAVLSRQQLLLSGGSGATIDRWLRRGHLHRLHPGVYSLVPPTLLTAEGCWLGAVLAGPPGTVLSHQPAGQLAWIIDRRESVGLHVSLIGGKSCRRAGIIAHRPRSLNPVDVTKRLGIPTTTRTRTVWDLSGVLSPAATRRAFEQAEKLHDLDRPRLRAMLAAAPSRKGSRTIRELLQSGTIPLERTRSVLEELVIHVCTDNAIAMPAVNVPLLGHEVDFLWERERFVVEADGGEHLNERQRDKDNDRDVRLSRAGYLVRRYSWWALQDRRKVASEILSILRERDPSRHRGR